VYFNCHSWFSLKYGALSPQALWQEARRCQIKHLVLTDINNTSGWVEMLKLCQARQAEWPLQLGLGIEFRRQDQLLFIALAQNNAAFEQLNRYLSYHTLSGKPLLSRAPAWPNVQVVYPLSQAPPPQDLRPHEWVGIGLQDLTRLPLLPYRHHTDRLVAWLPVNHANKAGFNTHRLLRAMAHNTVLSKLPEQAQAQAHHTMRPMEQVQQLYKDFAPLVRNAQALAQSCVIDIPLGTNKNKAHFGPGKAQDHQQLTQLALQGFEWRYPDQNTYARQRLQKELDVIAQHNFEAYFLITWDVLRFAQHKGFAHVGRGSGANSIAAYCLGITDVDPVELDLYFERFLNPYRSTPPDFDIDFSWKERDEVLQYVFDRYTYEHASLLATYTTFQGRSIIRELGKVLGLPKFEIDRLVDAPEQYRGHDANTRLIFKYAQHLKDMPHALSIHAGGVLIAQEPIYAYTATAMPPKGFPITHFDMYGAEDLGLHKFDILSQRGLGHIKDAVTLVQEQQGHKVDIRQVAAFKKDPKIKALLRQGRTMGCFYIESPAMRMLLNKLSCQDYITLVAASSIIRPGVARSGMMRAYIERHHNPTGFDYIHPKMKELMQESYGVMVYQEDVLKVAHHFAGLDLGHADILRRGMSGKYRSKKQFEQVQQAFFDNCRQKGYPEEITQEVWRQIESFSGYSFSKAHSASYAVESYQSLYLKAHYPLAFITAVINNFGGFYRTEFYLHEARMNGATIEAPCLNHSLHLTRLDGTTLWLGFIHLKSLQQKLAQLIPQERQANGPFADFDDVLRRLPLSHEQLTLLIRIGALRFTGLNKRQLLWQAQLHFNKQAKPNGAPVYHPKQAV